MDHLASWAWCTLGNLCSTLLVTILTSLPPSLHTPSKELLSIDCLAPQARVALGHPCSALNFGPISFLAPPCPTHPPHGPLLRSCCQLIASHLKRGVRWGTCAAFRKSTNPPSSCSNVQCSWTLGSRM